MVAKLEEAPHRLGDLCTVHQGLHTGDNEKYLSTRPKSGKWKPAVGGKHVGRYAPLVKDQFVYYEPRRLDAPRRREIFDSPEKLVVQEIRNITLPRRIVATYDNQQFYCLQSTNVINQRAGESERWPIKYLLGLLNSRAINFYFRQRFSGNNHIASNQLAQIPIPQPDPARQARVVALVELRLALSHRHATAKSQRLKTQLENEMGMTDEQLDALVYELYGLSDDDIQLVEAQA